MLYLISFDIECYEVSAIIIPVFKERKTQELNSKFWLFLCSLERLKIQGGQDCMISWKGNKRELDWVHHPPAPREEGARA